MKITTSTTIQEVSTKTKSIMHSGIIPNMLLKDESKPTNFSTDNQYWPGRVCNRHE